MNTLLSAYGHTLSLLVQQPRLLLAYAVTTFDPVWALVQPDLTEINYDGEEPMVIALQITRKAFPDIYVQAIQALYCNVEEDAIETLILNAIRKKGIEISSLEAMGWGIPLDAFGVDLDDPAFYDSFPHVLPALEPFSLPESLSDDEIGLHTLKAGRFIAQSLRKQEGALCKVGYLYSWLFGCTGNSLTDYTYEGLDGIPPLTWEPEDIKLAIEMTEEANAIIADVNAGIDHLTHSPELVETIHRHVNYLLDLQQEKRLEDHANINLRW